MDYDTVPYVSAVVGSIEFVKLSHVIFTTYVFNAWCPLKDHTYLNKHAVLKSLFNKVTSLKACNFVKNRL